MGMKENASKGVDEVKKEAEVIKGERSKDKIYTTTRTFEDADSARFEFTRSKERLFNVNGWSDIPGVANAVFELFSASGTRLARNRVQKDDFIMIDLPGPLPFYWVRVIEISENEDFAQFTVQPTHDPTDNDDKTVTDHFFQDKARSIFRVERKDNEITAMEIGKNEAINNQKEEAGAKAVVNTLVSEGGWAGFQKYQWKNLTDYLVGLRTPTK
jgi:hypothetical protein